ncbi:MAG: nitroreductase/quinone reductase family protein [Acidimicrobiales bacterium]
MGSGGAHLDEGGVGGGEQRRVGQAGAVDEDADVLGQKGPGDGGEPLQIEPAAGDDLRGVAAAAPAREDRGQGLPVEPSGCGQLEDLGRQGQARVASGDEREPIWSQQKQDYPGFADYEAKTNRQIPVVVLEPA